MVEWKETLLKIFLAIIWIPCIPVVIVSLLWDEAKNHLNTSYISGLLIALWAATALPALKAVGLVKDNKVELMRKERDHALADKDAAISTMKEAIVQKNTAIDAKEAAIAEKKEAIAEAAQRGRQQDQAIANLAEANSRLTLTNLTLAQKIIDLQ